MVSLFSFHAGENRPLSTKAESADRFIDDFYYLVYIILIAFFVVGLPLLAPVPQWLSGVGVIALCFIPIFSRAGRQLWLSRNVYRHIFLH
ncbi:hypothetical protein C8R31_104111 [Nitrosospira sp. Nsp2]|nr:hypothetical protein C8R31_104111 [Nitrosospira sp. Nsp2]